MDFRRRALPLLSLLPLPRPVRPVHDLRLRRPALTERTEGWACYATDLMEELGFLTPLERVSQQHTRVRMLARAIVDIELHQGTMSFADAVRFYETHVGMSPAAAKAEAVKNSMFPCTAIMYWLGTQGIHDLRAEIKRREGFRFSLRRFHGELLGYGSIPVPLIARMMTEGSSPRPG